jgi:hypothetical protein
MLKHELLNLLEDIAELGATKALIKTGQTRSTITLSEAYRRYSTRKVDGWIKEGKIEKIKNGPKNSKVELDLMRCEILNKETLTHRFETLLNDSN